MGSSFRAALVIAGLSSTIAVATAQKAADVPLEIVLDRAGWYLDSFVEEFENVVAEERYVQDSSTNLPSFSRAIAKCAPISSWSSRPAPTRWCRSAM
jgi:hypothetical protein